MDKIGDTTTEVGAQARSLMCQDCGKLFANQDMAQFHAYKTQHSNFAESTEDVRPLTEEEKAQKLAELKIKMAERRAQRKHQEEEDERRREIERRKQGKEAQNIKQKYKEAAQLREIEQRRREKQEEIAARERVRRQIEQDRLARAAAVSVYL